MNPTREIHWKHNHATQSLQKGHNLFGQICNNRYLIDLMVENFKQSEFCIGMRQLHLFDHAEYVSHGQL